MLYIAQKLYRIDDKSETWLSIAISPNKMHVEEAIHNFLMKIETLHNDDPMYRCDAIVMIRIVTSGGKNENEHGPRHG